MTERSKLIEHICIGMNQEPWGQEAELRKPGSDIGPPGLSDCGNLK